MADAATAITPRLLVRFPTMMSSSSSARCRRNNALVRYRLSRNTRTCCHRPAWLRRQHEVGAIMSDDLRTRYGDDVVHAWSGLSAGDARQSAEMPTLRIAQCGGIFSSRRKMPVGSEP